ncbi:MAG: isocitrate lyase/phosphoenolpyruvate mutase family protein [Gammaproteobacteria bacterium]
MNQTQKARQFTQAHIKGDPIILYNVWDAGSGRAVEAAGASALATGSWSVAAAHGYEDGEAIPFSLLEIITQRLCACTNVPVSIDFEAGFGMAPSTVAEFGERLIHAGAVGVNFEDQAIAAGGLIDTTLQAERIAALRDIAGAMPLHINARTDSFLLAAPDQDHKPLLSDAIARAAAYEAAGASSFFAPGLNDPALIGQLCAATALPVNVMLTPASAPLGELAAAGVARCSYGPGPYRQMIETLGDAARTVYAA